MDPRLHISIAVQGSLLVPQQSPFRSFGSVIPHPSSVFLVSPTGRDVYSTLDSPSKFSPATRSGISSSSASLSPSFCCMLW